MDILKCEIKLFNTTLYEFLTEVVSHPIKNRLEWLKALVFVIPVVLINEATTPQSDLVCICGLMVAVFVFFAILRRKCNQHKSSNNRSK